MNYRIWKADLDTYRILNMNTGRVTVLHSFIAYGCKFMVDLDGYEKAKQRSFADTGLHFDYFAWIEATNIFMHLHPAAENQVFYNPFKHPLFRNRQTLEAISEASKVAFHGNKISYC